LFGERLTKVASREKYYELLDIPKFARPSVADLQAQRTAFILAERLDGGGFMSYGQIWPRLSKIFQGLATDRYIQSEFKAYKASWKNRAIQEAYTLLRDRFGGKGTWYPIPGSRKFVLGCWFKTSIKGFWAYEGRIYAVLINCRKHQPLSWADTRFLARGIYELHCIDDPNNPIPLVVDLALHPGDEKRKARVYEVPVDDAVSIERFEDSMLEFLRASSMAGISLPPPPELEHILDLFRR
jgi:hypothetical protein